MQYACPQAHATCWWDCVEGINALKINTKQKNATYSLDDKNLTKIFD